MNECKVILHCRIQNSQFSTFSGATLTRKLLPTSTPTARTFPSPQFLNPKMHGRGHTLDHLHYKDLICCIAKVLCKIPFTCPLTTIFNTFRTKHDNFLAWITVRVVEITHPTECRLLEPSTIFYHSISVHDLPPLLQFPKVPIYMLYGCTVVCINTCSQSSKKATQSKGFCKCGHYPSVLLGP